MLHAVQALRILSALWVVLYHTQGHALLSPSKGLYTQAIAFGYLGVDVFFVISGFIMAMNTAAAPRGASTAWTFFLQRGARIYSGWWPVFLVCLLLYGIGGGLAGKDLWGSLWLYQLNFHVLVLPVTWTLTFELYFYALVALSLLLPPLWRTRAMYAFACAIVAVNGLWWLSGRYEPAQFEHTHLGMHLLLSPLCLEFVLGYLLQRHLPRITPHGLWLALGTSLTAAALYLYATHMAIQPSGLAGFFHYPERAILAGLLASSLIALFLRLEAWLPRRLSLWGGDVSYMVYLLHLPVIWLFERTMAPLSLGTSPALHTLVVLAATLAFAACLHYLVEKPIYQALRRSLKR